MARIGLSQLSGAARATRQRAHWIAATIGLATSAAFGIAMLSQPIGTHFSAAQLDISTPFSTDRPFLGQAIGATAGSRQVDGIRLLAGVSGETFASGVRQTAQEDRLADGPLPNIAPVYWDELSDANCLTVTAKNGKTFSFRILGINSATPAAPSKPAAQIDLAIAACANNGEPVEKAVIEQHATPAAKDVGAGHSL